MIIERDIVIEGRHGKPILVDLFYRNTNEPKPMVIFSHGFKGFKDWGPFNIVATQFANAGFAFAKLNFAFNGTTPQAPTDFSDLHAFGNNNFSKELDDLDVLLNWFEQANLNHSHFNLNSISLIGHSRGGGISILKAGRDNRIKNVVAWNSVNEFGKYLSGEQIEEWKQNGVIYLPNARTGQLMPLYIQLYKDTLKKSNKLNIQKAVEGLKIPFLIVHSKDDETVSVNDAIAMHNWNRQSKLLLIDNANHTFNSEHPYLEEKLPAEFQQVVESTISFLNDSDK